MTQTKLGLYRKNATIQRKRHKITPMDFDICLYASENDYVTQYSILRDVSQSKTSVLTSLEYLVDKGYLRITQEFKAGIGGIKRKYVITPKTRKMVTDFYMGMFPNQ